MLHTNFETIQVYEKNKNKNALNFSMQRTNFQHIYTTYLPTVFFNT